MPEFSSASLEATVHLIQVALTPVFLLSGIAALMNVFAGRLARVADRLDRLSIDIRTADQAEAVGINREIHKLHERLVALDWAAVLASIGAGAICLNIMTLFLLSMHVLERAWVLLLFFGIAMICTLGSVAAYLAEMLMSSSILRARMSGHLPGVELLRWPRRRRRSSIG